MNYGFRKTIFSLFLFFSFFLFALPVGAVCPVCTVAVGGGVLLSQYLGVDDLIIGIWVGGFILSIGIWTGASIKKKFFKGQNWLITAFLWLTTVLGLKQVGLIGHPTCKIHGHDKLLSGIVFGTVAFLIGYFLDWILRRINRKNLGKAIFPYQKIVLPVGWLVVATAFAFQICRWGLK